MPEAPRARAAGRSPTCTQSETQEASPTPAALSSGAAAAPPVPRGASTIWPLWLLFIPSPKAQGFLPSTGQPPAWTVCWEFYCAVPRGSSPSTALCPAAGRAAAPLPPPFVTRLSWAGTGPWQGWGQQGSLRAVRSHCRTSARPVPSRALVSSIVMGWVAQDTMSCMRNSDFISTRDM